MNRIYLDNAATTALDPLVLEAMMPFLTTHYGNPSSVHGYGRDTRIAIENARKSVAAILGAKPSEIFFTAGGTESSNTAIISAVRDLRCKRIITSLTEHHATLHTVEYLHERGEAEVQYARLLPDGHIDMTNLETLLRESKSECLVSLMHANNETGNMLDIETAGELCKLYGAIFHSDAVQTVGHFPLNLSKTKVDMLSASGHKFHGPKGVGVLYVSEQIKIKPLIHGGSQERNMRAGTENVAGIIGFAKALELATENYDKESPYIRSLKLHLMTRLALQFPCVCFNGDACGSSLYTVLSVGFPKTEKTEMLLFNLDMSNICVSSGSACTSGANGGSHVIKAIRGNNDRVTVRFSFSKYNTKEEIDYVVEKLGELM